MAKSTPDASPSATQTDATGDRATRRRLLEQLKWQGPQAAAALAAPLGLTPMAVRLQLYALADEGLVEATSHAAGRGRPTKLWALTDDAACHFPDAHQSLAVDLIENVTAVFGAEGLRALIDRHSDQQMATYSAHLHQEESPAERVQKLAELRSKEGYMASVLEDDAGTGWWIAENHCPICSAARACSRLCANELDVFQAVLGPDFSVRREEHILQGARRCLYRIDLIATP